MASHRVLPSLWQSPRPALCPPGSLRPLLPQIEKVDLRDEGVYTCAATNLAGESRREVALKVLGEEVPGMAGDPKGPWGQPLAGDGRR